VAVVHPLVPMLVEPDAWQNIMVASLLSKSSWERRFQPDN
jgi:hypothetical protein